MASKKFKSVKISSAPAAAPVEAPESDDEDQAPDESAEAMFARLDTEKTIFLTRAREAASFTLPSLIPPAGATATTEYPTPWQSVGAEGVNNLASKLLLTLLPPNDPCFRLIIDPFKLQQAAGKSAPPEAVAKLKTEMEKALGTVEGAVMSEIETCAIRVGAFEALRHLVVSGNALAVVPPSGSLRVFHLTNYVVERDCEGNPLIIITRERVSLSMLPKEVRAAVRSSDKTDAAKRDSKAVRQLDLYTKIALREDGSKWDSVQECKGIVIESTKGVYAPDQLPYIPLRFNRIDGENYGRGFVEEYIGDIKVLDGLSRCIAQGSAAGAKILFLVNPNGTTDVKELADAQNGDFVAGNEADVHCLQMDKYSDFRVALETIGRIETRLTNAFIMNRGATRQAERVTAEEIRLMAQELESTLGGVYSILSQEFQLPLVNVLLARLQKQDRCPKLPKNIVKPAIVTGVEALGRGNDLTKLDTFVAGANQTVGAENVGRYLNLTEYFKRRATALRIDDDGLIKTEEQVAQEAQQAQAGAMAQALGPNAINKLGDHINQAQQQGHEASMAQASAPPTQ